MKTFLNMFHTSSVDKHDQRFDPLKFTVVKVHRHYFSIFQAKEGRWTTTSHYCPLDLFSG